MTLPPNPLRAGLEHDRVPDPCIVVIFGASGDLTSRKLVPALYALALEQRLPVGFTVLGVGRRPFPEDRFRQEMQEAVAAHGRTGAPEPAAWAAFAEGLFYEPLDVQNPEAYGPLAARLDALGRARGTRGNVLFYLATPPSAFPPIVRGLGLAGLASAGAGEPAVWRRLVLEKPIGHDLESARALNRVVAEWFAESQVYRIDHYLGKETVQNLLVFRFANEIFEPIWNRAHVHHVQITVAESLGVEGRGAYYEESGALRDMVQNHLLQLLCLVAMEPPATFAADHVRDERTKVLQAVHPIRADDADQVAVRAQYERGTILGKPVPGYREEPGVAAGSTTETYAAVRLALDNWRWAGVPFYLRSGKRLARRLTEIAIQFRRPPQLLFGADAEALPPNHLVLRIQPDEGIAVRFAAKLPVQEFQLRPVTMDFRYGTSFGVTAPEAYERLLLDAMRGDATLFARVDWVEAAWSLLAPIQTAWAAGAAKLATYEAGSAGPPEAGRLLEREGRRWRRL
jgi:glucose-6-phosphate 1-dehydrogenase